MCRDKSIRGLGVNDMILVQQVISGKWQWSLIFVGTCMWKDIVSVRLGRHMFCRFVVGRVVD